MNNRLILKLKQYHRIVPSMIIQSRNYAIIIDTIHNFFGELPHLSLSAPSTRFSIQANPTVFAENYKSGVLIFDAHLYPELLAFILTSIGKSKDGPYILITPYWNPKWDLMLANNKLKVVTLNIEGAVFKDLAHAQFNKEMLFENGPEYCLQAEKIPTNLFYKDYLDKILSEEILQEMRLREPVSFIKFLGALSAQTSTAVHLSDLADIASVSVNTIIEWMAMLEEKQWIYRLENFPKSWNKRLIKHPKYFFRDIGLCNYLFNTYGDNTLLDDFKRKRFNNLIMNEMLLNLMSSKASAKAYFWQDHKLRDLSLLIQTPKKLLLTEIINENLDEGISNAQIRNMKLVKKLSKSPKSNCFIIHMGDKSFDHLLAKVISWRDI